MKPDGGATLVDFRFAVVEGWKIDKATLLVHLSAGKMPRELRVTQAGGAARWRRLKVRDYGSGWMEIAVPPEMVSARRGLLVRGAQLDRRQTVRFAPYLIVEGSR